MALNEKRILEKVNSRFVVSIYLLSICRNLSCFVYFIYLFQELVGTKLFLKLI